MTEQSGGRSKRVHWAEDRTDLAEDRTALANERTFAGWLRTGMAAVAVALGMQAVFRSFEPVWFAKAAASVFLLAAASIFWVARRKALATLAEIDTYQANPLHRRGINWLTALLLLGTLGVGLILWSV